MDNETVKTVPGVTEAARFVFDQVRDKARKRRVAVAVAGEAGVGKSGFASELVRLATETDLAAYVFNQNDYFFYPPKASERLRRKDVRSVGLREVNLRLLDEHLGLFRNSPKKAIGKPVVRGEEVEREIIAPASFAFAVVVGTYASLLKNVDYRVFIDLSYRDLPDYREKSEKGLLDEFAERVLESEHKIVSRHKSMADFIVQRDFKVTVQRQKPIDSRPRSV